MTRRLAAIPDRPLRAVGMIRVSDIAGRGDDLTSPDLQRHAIETYADGRGMQVVEWVEALDESGSSSKSPWWRRLDQVIERVETHEIDAVLVWKYSRAARHRKRWAVALDRVEVAGGVIESATEQLDTTTSTGRLARGMLAELAAWEAEVKSEQWKETQERRRRLGLTSGGGRRFGYTYDRVHGHRPDPAEGALLAEMYARYAAGSGAMQIATWLNVAGAETLRGKKWLAGGVLRQLDSGFAAGLIHYQDSFLPGAHPPLINMELWEAFRRQRERARLTPTKQRNPRHVFAGILKCGLCHASMGRYEARHRPGGPVYALFRCITWQANRTCPGRLIYQSRVETHVLDWLRTISVGLDERKAVTQARKVAAAAVRADRERLVRDLAKADAAVDKLSKQWATTPMSQQVFERLLGDLLAERAKASRLLAETSVEAEALSVGHISLAKSLLAEWDRIPVLERRDSLKQLIRRIDVTAGPKGKPGLDLVPIWEDR